MNFKKITSLTAVATLFLGTSSFALLNGWTGEGRVTDVYVGAPGAYTTPAAVVFALTGGTGTNQFAFPLEGEAGRAMLSQIYNAKTNGYWVQVSNDGQGTIAGVSRSNRILVQQ